MPLPKDAREAVDRLIEEGVPEDQAHAFVDLLIDADEQVATRQGLEALHDQIETTESRIQRHVETMIGAAEDRLKSSLLFHLYTAVGIISALILILWYLQ